MKINNITKENYISKTYLSKQNFNFLGCQKLLRAGIVI